MNTTHHISLLEASKSDNDLTLASIFVNPIQFNNRGDLEKYPRNESRDFALLQANSCDAVFCPSVEEIYSQFPQIKVEFGESSKILEGKFRPGHFNGVALVVAKFFNIIQPTRAYFGQKDYQQFLLVAQLVKDLSIQTEIFCCPTQREPNGLAMSSRNERLNEVEKQEASLLFKSLSYAAKSLPERKLADIKRDVESHLTESGIRLEYFELATRNGLEILDQYNPSIASILLIAAYVGDVRLIDNLFV